ncbi:MAG: flagellar FlbD family protein [Planctomycetia bacterium]|nr:flagellar FlbD family protein [Planctomycetia bacterium]
MIKVTNLSGEPFLLNAELIRYVEARPDTFITLLQGERIVVRETMDEVLHLTLDYQRSKHFVPLRRHAAASATGEFELPPLFDEAAA